MKQNQYISPAVSVYKITNSVILEGSPETGFDNKPITDPSGMSSKKSTPDDFDEED